MIKVLSMTVVDWQSFDHDSLESNPVDLLDRYGIARSDPVALIFAGCAMRDNTTTPAQSLREPHGAALQLVYFSIITDVQIDHCDTNLKVFRSLGVDIVSGTLYDWRNAIFVGSQSSATKTARRWYNEVYTMMSASRLKEIFSIYKKKVLTDGTFTLGV